MSTLVQSKDLFFQEGNSDKEYHVQVTQEPAGFKVDFQYGRRGGTLQTGTKTPQPVDESAARKIYEKIVNEKIAKGYHE